MEAPRGNERGEKRSKKKMPFHQRRRVQFEMRGSHAQTGHTRSHTQDAHLFTLCRFSVKLHRDQSTVKWSGSSCDFFSSRILWFSGSLIFSVGGALFVCLFIWGSFCVSKQILAAFLVVARSIRCVEQLNSNLVKKGVSHSVKPKNYDLTLSPMENCIDF